MDIGCPLNYNYWMIRDISEGEIYHVYNRGTRKEKIFHDDRDRTRFLFLITHFQSPVLFFNMNHDISIFRKRLNNGHPMSIKSGNLVAKIIDNRIVDLLAFTLMPNHFHLLIKEARGNGISTYMQRILNAYTKYYNTKYETSGHLFQGPYKIVHVKDNDQLLYTSAYIHRNCRELKIWSKKESLYPWSSFRDYVKENRWGALINSRVILEQFEGGEEYKSWVDSSAAKDKGLKEIVDEGQE